MVSVWFSYRSIRRESTAEATPVTDLNGDGKVDKLDLAEIRKIIIAFFKYFIAFFKYKVKI